jgi:hypothetical protein
MSGQPVSGPRPLLALLALQVADRAAKAGWEADTIQTHFWPTWLWMCSVIGLKNKDQHGWSCRKLVI